MDTIKEEDGVIEDEIEIQQEEEEGKEEEGGARIVTEGSFEPPRDTEGSMEAPKDEPVQEIEEEKKPLASMAQFLTNATLNQEQSKEDTIHADMTQVDKLFVSKANYKKGEVMQVSLKSMVNFRDRLGRTALHVAVALGHKEAVETLLFLNSNPHIEDCFG
jgi:hypothetical protein